MNCAWTVGADRWKQVLRPVVMGDVFKLLAIASEENCPRTGSVANADDIALEKWRAVGCRRERLVVSAMTSRLVGNRGFVEAWREVAD
jgi:hypothetical protein